MAAILLDTFFNQDLKIGNSYNVLVFFSVIPLKLSYEKQAPSVSAIQM
jgi:hypothetical protein